MIHRIEKVASVVEKMITEKIITDENDKQHFCNLLKAILNVDEEYIKYDNFFFINSDEKEFKEHVERVFAYELYRQWANLVGGNLFLNGEIVKELRNSEENASLIKTYPDLVLHGGQANTEKEKQLIVCEIKRYNAGNKAFFDDIIKLSWFMSDTFSHPFKYGVFIITVKKGKEKGKDSQSILNDFVEYIKHDEQCIKQYAESIETYAERIICIAYDGNTIVCDTLENCLNDE